MQIRISNLNKLDAHYVNISSDGILCAGNSYPSFGGLIVARVKPRKDFKLTGFKINGEFLSIGTASTIKWHEVKSVVAEFKTQTPYGSEIPS